MPSKEGFRVNVYVEIERKKSPVTDIPVTHMSLEDIMRLEDECTVTLGVPTGVLGPATARTQRKPRAARRRVGAFGGGSRARKAFKRASRRKR
jgi:hypothetical protein